MRCSPRQRSVRWAAVAVSLCAAASAHAALVQLSMSPPAGGTVTGGGSYTLGASCTIEALPLDGYQFGVWQDATTGLPFSFSATYTFPVNSDYNLIAYFLEGYAIVTSESPAAGGTTSITAPAANGFYPSGSSCTVTATYNAGYRFVSWTEGGSVESTESSYTFTVDANRLLVANFGVERLITTTADPSGTGFASGGGWYGEGAECTVSASPYAGYEFVDWTDGVGGFMSAAADYTFTVGATDLTLQANFVLAQYTISTEAIPVAGGTTTGDGTYTFLDTCIVEATENADYQFVNWTEAGFSVSLSSSLIYSFTPSRDIALVANFVWLYTITATDGSGVDGTIDPAGSVRVAEGSSQTFTFAPNAGNAVDVVTVDAVPLLLPYTSYIFPNVTMDHTIDVQFGVDTDLDGLTDAYENAANPYATDPNKWDTDGDGHGDGVEVMAGYDPLDPASHGGFPDTGSGGCSPPRGGSPLTGGSQPGGAGGTAVVLLALGVLVVVRRSSPCRRRASR